jgi:hypothetical protein
MSLPLLLQLSAAWGARVFFSIASNCSLMCMARLLFYLLQHTDVRPLCTYQERRKKSTGKTMSFIDIAALV